MDCDYKVSIAQLCHWANAIRNLPDHGARTRALEALWWGQLASKGWLINTLGVLLCARDGPHNVYIFGGWTGVLANMLLDSHLNIGSVRSIDIDPWCESVADTVNKVHEMNGWRFKAVTADMGEYQYQWDITPHVIINTSTEHVSQDVYDSWYQNIPDGCLIVAQGNNYYSCGEHVRCSSSISEFMIQNRATNPLWSGSLPLDIYTRYMAIWRK